MTTYVLSISTFAGLVPGARHFFGRIRWRCRARDEMLEHSLERTVDGRETSSFDEREEIVELAKRFVGEWQPGDLLLLGVWANCDPMEVIAGDPAVVERAKALYARAVEIDFWEKREHKAEMTRICSEWDKLTGF